MNLIDAVRFEIGDNDSDNGIFPGQKQFDRTQLDYAAAYEGVTEYDNPTQMEIGRVSAKMLEMAAAAWATQPVESELGPMAEVNKTRTHLRALAAELRAKWGFGGTSTVERIREAPNYSGSGLYVLPPGIN